MIPLKYIQVARAQVSQFIEGNGPSGYNSAPNTPLSTIADFNSGASTVTWASEPTTVEYYAPLDPAVNVEYPN
jgi:hypothetical protein